MSNNKMHSHMAHSTIANDKRWSNFIQIITYTATFGVCLGTGGSFSIENSIVYESDVFWFLKGQSFGFICPAFHSELGLFGRNECRHWQTRVLFAFFWFTSVCSVCSWFLSNRIQFSMRLMPSRIRHTKSNLCALHVLIVCTLFVSNSIHFCRWRCVVLESFEIQLKVRTRCDFDRSRTTK